LGEAESRFTRIAVNASCQIQHRLVLQSDVELEHRAFNLQHIRRA
jgi:hypothetical protein